MLTFEQFQSTRRHVADIGVVLQDDGLMGLPGYLYCRDTYYVLGPKAEPIIDPKGGPWSTMIGNREYRSDRLAAVERPLYDFHVSEDSGTDEETSQR